MGVKRYIGAVHWSCKGKERVSWVLRRRSAHGLLLQHALIPGEKTKTNRVRWLSFWWNTRLKTGKGRKHQTHKPTPTDSRGRHAMPEGGMALQWSEVDINSWSTSPPHIYIKLRHQIIYKLSSYFNTSNVNVPLSLDSTPNIYISCT